MNRFDISPIEVGSRDPRDPGLKEQSKLSFMVLALLSLLSCLGHLPLRWRKAVGWHLGALFSFLPTPDRRIAKLQMGLCLQAPPPVSRVYGNIGQTVMESLNLDPLLKAQAVRCDNWDRLVGLLDRGKGVVTLTAHTGNWDLLAAWVVSRGVVLTAVGREARSPMLQALLRSLRARYGIDTVWRSRGAGGLKEIIEKLGRNEVVAALVDQDTRVKSEMAPFFGRLAATPCTLVELAKRQGAAIVSAFIFREADGRFVLRAEEINGALSVRDILGEYNRRLEASLKDYPDQWVWFHKRWRTNEAGVRFSSREYENILKQQCLGRCS